MSKVWIPVVAGVAALGIVGTVGIVQVLRTHDVELTVDGAAQVLTVRDRTVGSLLENQGIELGEYDVVLPGVDTKIVEGLEVDVAYGRPLELTVDGESRTVWTTARSVGDALRQLDLDEADSKLSATRATGITRRGLDLEIMTAKDVTLKAAGESSKVTVAGTVADLLSYAEIDPDSNDIVKPDVDTVLKDGMKVTFVDVTVKESKKKVSVPFKKKTVKSSKMDKGTSKVTTKGVKGSKTETYTDVYHDGKLKSSKLKSSKVTKKPKTQVTTVGTRKVEKKSSNLTPASGSSCKASYYWQGQMTANGERFNPDDLTAAHKTFKFGTKVKVTNPKNDKTVVVRINDRGPYISGRCLDLSRAAMKAIGGTSAGVITVNYEVV
ncbi:septal ring lytic transglycosylase RlpA family protein [Tessaracoccus caeni]|uniref:septal ring lytic transglycosylase RlpA family protein n=1 Tax=Tessaracoccus caeni TaxID=3031239 RepID=UPI0023DAC556|nr:septal ring lytic transglycosylase RlpA family protein [Tessaracoccus caeni]MDF1487287.1 septal ring lytic transglycosylase RlpA family protein [Tessaracoccus caeni]